MKSRCLDGNFSIVLRLLPNLKGTINWVRVFEMWRDKDLLELNSAKFPREHRLKVRESFFASRYHKL